MSDRVLVAYLRDGTVYTGAVSFGDEVVRVERVSFHDLFKSAHSVLVRMPEGTQVDVQRTDRAGLSPITMDAAAAQQLREDPEGYIASVTVPHRTVNLKRSGRVSKLAEAHTIPTTSSLRIGHATVADAFGDHVYLPAQLRLAAEAAAARVESPITGRWISVEELSRILGKGVVVTEVKDKAWVRVPMASLLALDCERLFLSVPWSSSAWVSKDELKKRYEKYTQEKNNAEHQ